MPRPTKFRPKRDHSVQAARAKALTRLENFWKLENDEGEWEPESELAITPMMKAVDGGIDHCINALRSHEDEDAQTFLAMYDRCKKSERLYLRIEDIAFASGVGSLRLGEVLLTALRLYSDKATDMILSAAMPKVLKATVKAATDEIPIVADIGGRRVVVGHTNGDTKAMEMLLKSRGIVPIPKGSQTAIQINAGEARGDKESEGGHEWKYPEDRTKAIMAVINPKQLESGTLSTDHPRHFNQNAPIVFER